VGCLSVLELGKEINMVTIGINQISVQESGGIILLFRIEMNP